MLKPSTTSFALSVLLALSASLATSVSNESGAPAGEFLLLLTAAHLPVSVFAKQQQKTRFVCHTASGAQALDVSQL